MNKKIFIFIGILIIIVLGAIFLRNKQVSDSTPSTSSGQESSPQAAPIQAPDLAPSPIPTPISNPIPAPLPTPAPVSISIQNFKFNPDHITVKKRTTVTWANNDGAPHTITADQGTGPASGTLNSGDTYSYTFNAAGTFDYHCSIHPSMHGNVTVVE